MKPNLIRPKAHRACRTVSAPHQVPSLSCIPQACTQLPFAHSSISALPLLWRFVFKGYP
jgi:hypothetical protein